MNMFIRQRQTVQAKNGNDNSSNKKIIHKITIKLKHRALDTARYRRR